MRASSAGAVLEILTGALVLVQIFKGDALKRLGIL